MEEEEIPIAYFPVSLTARRVVMPRSTAVSEYEWMEWLLSYGPRVTDLNGGARIRS